LRLQQHASYHVYLLIFLKIIFFIIIQNTNRLKTGWRVTWRAVAVYLKEVNALLHYRAVQQSILNLNGNRGYIITEVCELP